MRAIPPCVACAMFLLGLSVTGSLADPSIVADLDSNATNGPDTLQAEVGDTVLVRVWITDSADSLVGFGITVGDTSGTLTWAEGDTDAVYTVPTGWMAVSVLVDGDGRLLLQGYDFTFSEPLHIPHEVARLQFVADSPESCAVFSWNTDISGWQNWAFTEGTFADFEGAVVCVAGQEDGGGDEGEGGEDDTPGAGPYPCEPDLIEVMFAWDSRVRLRDGVTVDLESDATAGVDSVLSDLATYTWQRITSVSEEVVDEIQETAEGNLQRPVYNLNNAHELRVPDGTDVWELSRRLEQLDGILRAYPVPLPGPLPAPNFEPNQGYLDSAYSIPAGVDAEYAWERAGGDGEGVIVCDVEASWNYSHADLSKLASSQINPNALPESLSNGGDINHGTASVGILVSDPNGWGTTGICYASSLQTCGDVWPDSQWHPPWAIVEAIPNLSAGDVLLLEEQWTVGNYKYPIEWYSDSLPCSQTENLEYLAIVNAVGNGINVIEPGGNGGDDTDSLAWLEVNSGAILVGAGATGMGTDRMRLAWGGAPSSYGSRFDLQGWGDCIYTTGWGHIYNEEGEDYWYTNNFGNTSGAAAVVAGAVADLVGYWKANVSEDPPPPDTVRALLKRTGRAQVDFPEGSPGHIGPRPDLRAAIAALTTATSVRSSQNRFPGHCRLFIAPNPARAGASVSFEIGEERNAVIELFDPAGRLVRVLANKSMPAGISTLEWDGLGDDGRQVSSGAYFWRLLVGNQSTVQRIVIVRGG